MLVFISLIYSGLIKENVTIWGKKCKLDRTTRVDVKFYNHKKLLGNTRPILGIPNNRANTRVTPCHKQSGQRNYLEY